MLVCNISLRPPRRAITCDISETAAAADASTIGQIVFATLVDDPASVGEVVDAFLGEIMLEAAAAADIVEVGLGYDGAVNEAVSAGDSPDGTVTGAVTTWNPADKSGTVTLSGGDLVAQATTSSQAGVRSTTSKSSGKVYFEVLISSSAGISNGCGIATTSASLAGGVTGSNICVVSGFNGNIWFNGTNVGAASTSGLGGKTACFAIDFVNSRFWARADAGNWNNTAGSNPATNTGGIDISALFPSNAAYALGLFNSTTPTLTANFGATAFAQPVPSGFSSWG